VSQESFERARDLARLQGADEQRCVASLTAAAAAHETPELGFDGAPSPGRLVLERAEGAEVSFGLDDPLDAVGAEGANELVLEVGVADEDAGFLDPSSLEGAAESALLTGVAEAGEPDVQALRAILLEVAPDRLRATHGDDRDPLSGEVATVPLGEGFHRDLVADALDEDYGSAHGTFT
jgi:hypothetical protein